MRILHRLLGEEELVCDLPVRLPVGYQLEDVALLAGEAGEPLVLDLLAPKAVHHLFVRRRVQ